MERAVSNTTTLLFLAKVKRLDLLQNLYKKIYIPNKILEEILIKETPELVYLKKYLGNYILEENPKNLRSLPLDEGEQAAISLCLEKKGNLFISDDLRARNFAESLGLPIIGTLGILLDNLRRRKINKKEAFSLLQQLLTKGMYLSTDVYAEVEKIIEES